MDNLGLIIGIILAVVFSVMVVAKATVNSAVRRATEAKENEARALEIKIKMSTGLEIINDFNELAHVYITLDRLNDAEGCMRKALAIAENELGQMDETLVPILENYSNVLRQMNRDVEADAMYKRARDIAKHRLY